MQGKPPQSKPPPKPARRVSPAEWAWLNRINRQLAHDEYMQAKREYWLAARPAKGESDRAWTCPDRSLTPQAQRAVLS